MYTEGNVLVLGSSLYLEHHGIKGQKWGVRRFQNPDGTLTSHGRKKVQKKVDKLKRKQVSSDNLRATLERRHPYAVAGSAIAGAIMGSASFALSGGTVGAIAAGAAICSAVSAASTHGSYSIAEAWEGRGSRSRKKKIERYENMLKQDGFLIEDGTLYLEHHGLEHHGDFFVKDGTLYLEHHGIKGQKRGVRRFQNFDGSLTAAGKARYGQGKVDSSGGGGGGGEEEEDEETKKKIEEAAKKLGMTVDEYRKKMGSKLYDALGGKHKDKAKELRSLSNEEIRGMNEAKRQFTKENGLYNKYKDPKNLVRRNVAKDISEAHRKNADIYRSNAANESEAYRKSIAGRYDRVKKALSDRGKKKEHKLMTSSKAVARKAIRVKPGTLSKLQRSEKYISRKKKTNTAKTGTIRKVGTGRGKKHSQR